MGAVSAIEILGWVAASLTLAAFSMKTMMPLRITAICASFFFVLYGFFSAAYPIMALHLALLPFNILRLIQLRRSNAAARTARSGDFSLDWIRAVMRPVKFSAGARLDGGAPRTTVRLSWAQTIAGVTKAKARAVAMSRVMVFR